MRSYILLFLLLFASSSQSQSCIEMPGETAGGFRSAQKSTSEAILEQYLVFTSNTTDDLRSTVTDGYPTEEIRTYLEDESIPYEDRYWLDCQIRSRIAQLLHTFYNADGEPVRIDADWVAPGEHYWQDTMIVNPPGDSPGDGLHRPHTNDEAGYLYNLMGEQIGSIAVASRYVSLSRDGSIGVLPTGGRCSAFPSGPDLYLCILYSDNTYREILIDDNRWLSSVYATSEDGSTIACNFFHARNSSSSWITLYDSSGEVIDEIEAYDRLSEIAISHNNAYIGYSYFIPDGSGIWDRGSDLVYCFQGGSSRMPHFSTNSAFCALADGYIGNQSLLVDLRNVSHISIPNEVVNIATPRRIASEIFISNDGKVISVGNEIYDKGISIICNEDYSNGIISPNGIFSMMYNTANTMFAIYDNRGARIIR